MHRGLQFSGCIVHRLLLRELHHDGPTDEMRFMLGSRSVRFSKVEFCLITGLKFGVIPDMTQIEEVENGLHQRYFNSRDSITLEELQARILQGEWQQQYDVVKLCLVLLLNCFLIGLDEREYIPIWQLRLVDDLVSFEAFPWGSHVYKYSIYGFINALHGRRQRFQERQEKKGIENHKKEKYSIFGFSYALLIFSFEVIPELAREFATRRNVDPIPRILRWEFTRRPRPNKLLKVFKARMFAEVKLTPTEQELGTWYYQGINEGGNLYPAFNPMENMQDASIEPDGDDARHRTETEDSMPRTRSRTRVAENRGRIRQRRIRVKLHRIPIAPSQIQECDDNGDGSQCPDPTSVGARYDDVEHARSPLREEVQAHWTRRFDELKETVQKLQEEFLASERDRQKQHEEVMCMLRTLQRDRGEHSTPLMDPIDPLSFTQDPSNIQRDIGHHFTPSVDPIDPPSFTQDPSDIQQDRGHYATPPMDPIDPPSFNQEPSDIQRDRGQHSTPPVDPIDPSSLSQGPTPVTDSIHPPVLCSEATPVSFDKVPAAPHVPSPSSPCLAVQRSIRIRKRGWQLNTPYTDPCRPKRARIGAHKFQPLELLDDGHLAEYEDFKKNLTAMYK
ncbi:hypothetical protein LWI29_027732 [Acer saccharum]|uniref:DUF1985 domain-containing protein n=1 Tax=Acer saccharum TaxID=4024 RepID=A0AA39RZX1_ACESA|nr:hypothetical protein LWI29_027732 [Acer saccharum]